jgi:ribonuclease BN (tRNA processing enzyme)
MHSIHLGMSYHLLIQPYQTENNQLELRYISQMGMDVTLADGTIIRAADVTGPPVKGRKLVYIGDTGDASNIIEAARDCDLLVHDATGLDPRKVAGTRRV